MDGDASSGSVHGPEFGRLLGLVVRNAFQILNVGCGVAPASGTPGGLVLEDAASNPEPAERSEFVSRELRDSGHCETTRQRDALVAASEVPPRRREANRNAGWDGDGTVDRIMRNKLRIPPNWHRSAGGGELVRVLKTQQEVQKVSSPRSVR